MKFLRITTWITWGITILSAVLYGVSAVAGLYRIFDASVLLKSVLFTLPLAVLLLGIRIAVSMNVFPRILYIIGSSMIAIEMCQLGLELCMYDVTPWPNEYSLPILISWLSVSFGLILIALLLKLIQVIRDR